MKSAGDENRRRDAGTAGIDAAEREIVAVEAGSGAGLKRVEFAIPAPTAASADAANLTPTQAKILEKLAWAETFLGTPDVDRQVLAFLIGKHKRTKTVLNDLGALRTAGVIEYRPADKLVFTSVGRTLVAWPAAASFDELISAIYQVLHKREAEILTFILASEGWQTTRDAIADHLGIHSRTKSYLNELGRLKTFGLISYGSQGAIFAADYLKEF